jgi:hypothetical protein
MANVPAPEYQTVWSNQIEGLRREYKNAILQYPDAGGAIDRVHLVLLDIARLTARTPISVGESPPWTQIVLNAAEISRNLHSVLKGKALFSALYGVYAEVLQDLKSVASTAKGQPTQENEEEFREQRRRKRNPSDEAAKDPKTNPTAGIQAPRVRSQQDVPTRNFFAPLRTAELECEGSKSETTDNPENEMQQAPPIVLTSQEHLIQLQKNLKRMCKGNFEFRSTRNGTRVINKEMADFSAIRSYFGTNNLPYYTFFPKSEKPIKAVIRHLPNNTPAEDISNGLVSLRYDVISVKQMTTRRSSTGPSNINLPLFLITLPRTQKSLVIFKLKSLCYIAVKVEAYRAQTGLTQCYNCQKFGHVWANCRQPPCCLWCGGGHLHKDCPEKGNAASKPACCNCKLGDEEEPHLSNYRGRSHAREELQKKKALRAPKSAMGRVFFSHFTIRGVSFAAALRANTQQ